jgi:hypothetical protein
VRGGFCGGFPTVYGNCRVSSGIEGNEEARHERGGEGQEEEGREGWWESGRRGMVMMATMIDEEEF